MGLVKRMVRRRVTALVVAAVVTPAVVAGVVRAAGRGADTAVGAANTAIASINSRTSGLVVGPGPQARYTIQPQPAAGSCRYRWINQAEGLVLPDSHCTPGAVNPRVTQGNLAATICRSGYTASTRPPLSVTEPEKRANAKAYGYQGNLAVAEYDHLLSLELGGDPNSPKNLWVEPNTATASNVNNPKDTTENVLNALVCDYAHLASHHAGSATSYLPLTVAQRLITSDWTTAVTDARKELVRG